MTREHGQQIGAALQPQETIGRPEPEVKKTPKMLRVEEYVGGDLGEFLHEQCSREDATLRGIARTIGELSERKETVNNTLVKAWIRKYDIAFKPLTRSEITRRKWQDPEHRKKVIRSYRRAWRDPEKRKKILKGHQSPEAKRRRGEGRARYWREHPEEKERLVKRNRRAKARRMREALGENPAEELKKLRRMGLSYREIGERIGIGDQTALGWARDLGADKVRKSVPRVDKERKRIVQEAWRRGIFRKVLEGRAFYILASRYLTDKPKTLEALAREHGVTRQDIHQIEKVALNRLKRAIEGKIVRKREAKWRVQKRTLGDDPKAALERLHWDEGLTLGEIGNRTGKSSDTIRLWMIEYGVPRRKPGHRRK